MQARFNRLLDKLSEYLAHRKGMLPILGMLLVVLNLVLQVYPGSGWLVDTDLFLHLGVLLALIGILIAWAL